MNAEQHQSGQTAHLLSHDFVLRGGHENRGAEFETPKVSSGERYGEEVYPSFPSRLGGLGSVVSSPSGVRGRSPGRKWVLVHFELEKTNLVMTYLIFFFIFIAHNVESNLQG